MLTEGGERDGVGGDGGTEARRGGVGGDGGEAEVTRGRRDSGELGEEAEERESGRAVGGWLGENSFNCSVGRENALVLKSVVVALFVEGCYYYT